MAEKGNTETGTTHAIGETTRWKPGQSGNPNGRPKKLPLTDALRTELAKRGKHKVVNEVAIARKLIDLALTGNMDAIREIADRTEGKPRQRIEQSGPDGGPIQQELQLPTSREEIASRIANLEAKAGFKLVPLTAQDRKKPAPQSRS